VIGRRDRAFPAPSAHARGAPCSVRTRPAAARARCCWRRRLTTLYSASNLDRHLVFNQGARFVLGGLLMLLIARAR
jgi:hypothetical protein